MRKHDQSSVAAEGARRADLNTVVARLEARSAELEVFWVRARQEGEIAEGDEPAACLRLTFFAH